MHDDRDEQKNAADDEVWIPPLAVEDWPEGFSGNAAALTARVNAQFIFRAPCGGIGAVTICGSCRKTVAEIFERLFPSSGL